VIDISVFAWFIPQSSLLEVLAIKKDVSLQVRLKVEEVAVVGDLAAEVVVDDVEDAAHPEGVAGVNQLVRSSVVSSELGLTLRQPFHQARNVQVFESFQERQCSYSTESESSMRLSANYIGNAALMALREKDRLCNSLEYVLGQIKGFCDESDYKDGS
jgi:hypothetical protein